MSVKFTLFRYSAVRSRMLRGVAVCLGFLCLIVLDDPVQAGSFLPDTGQTKCYNNTAEITCPSPGQAFYGQDANFLTRPRSYLGSTATETDLVTSLMWQKADDMQGRIWADAGVHCQSLELESYDDWRLPSRLELLTIVDSGRSGPAISPVFSCESDYYWSGSTTFNADFAWSVDFTRGGSVLSSRNATPNVRCVRGAPLPESVYVDNGDDTVTDKSTGLVWERAGSASQMSWESALAWCENATTGGYADWHLPNILEFASLVDLSRVNPAIDPVFTSPGNMYYSGTTQAGSSGDSVWMVDFYYGYTDAKFKTNMFHVRCVRSGQGMSSPGALNMLLLDGQ